MNKTIGDRIKYFRNKRSLTRKELANDICDESTLLRIEKGEQEAKISNIQRICERLEIPINYIVEPLEDQGIAYFKHIKRLCRDLVHDEDYEALQALIEEVQEDQQHLIEKEFIKKFINWHKAILLHRKEKKYKKQKQSFGIYFLMANLYQKSI